MPCFLKNGCGRSNNVTDLVEIFPGFQEISAQTCRKFEQHARKFGLETKSLVEVTSMRTEERPRSSRPSEGEFETKTVIITTAYNPKKLGAKGELELIGGVFLTAPHANGFFFRDQDRCSGGGGDSASPKR